MNDPFAFIRECRQCHLRKSATQVVVGDGPLDALGMIVGEAPGELEDLRGIPFFGRSGTYMFQLVFPKYGLRREDFYVTNIVHCRPPGNADPTKDVIAACRGNLTFQMETIKPRLIIPVGRFALEYFLKGQKISNVHGQRFDSIWRGRVVFPILHPAGVLRKRKTLMPVFEEDIERLAELVESLKLDRPEERLFKVRK